VNRLQVILDSVIFLAQCTPVRYSLLFLYFELLITFATKVSQYGAEQFTTIYSVD